MVDYVGQSTQATYTLLNGTEWVGLIMEETVCYVLERLVEEIGKELIV